MSSLLVDLRAHHAREFISRYLASPGRSPARPRLSRSFCFVREGRGSALRPPVNPPFEFPLRTLDVPSRLHNRVVSDADVALAST